MPLLTVVTIPVDGALPLALRRLGDAAHGLVDPVPLWGGGVCRWSDSVYVRLRAALVGRTARSRAAMAGSRLPCRVDVLALVVDIDTAVAGWEPEGKGGTVERLHTLTARGFRPQDCELLDGYCHTIERWVIAAAELLGDRQVAVTLRGLRCPSCGAGVVYRGAEDIRGWALRVTEAGCECQACRAFWPPAEFHWLARLLGCVALP